MHCPPDNLNYLNYVLIVSLFSFPAQQKSMFGPCSVSAKGAQGLMNSNAISVTFKQIVQIHHTTLRGV